ncbi:lactococcin [Scytonema tolypothrichoides VB-61278]|nr:lactococcin [Scytonema tolypothrichoides VB-61278]
MVAWLEREAAAVNFETLMNVVYVLAMAAGALLFVSWSRNPRGVPQYEYLIATFIPVWSGMAYLAMAFDQGKVAVDGQITYYARYLDWVVTTPLLLLALALTAMYRIKKDKTLIAALVGADVVMILTGLIADLSPTPLRYIWYFLGVAAFLVILYLVWVPLKAKADSQGPEIGGIFRRVAGLLSVLWVAYPLTWILGPSGVGLLNQTLDTALFTLVPILSKVGWSIVDLSSLRALQGRELPRGARAA